MRGEGMREEGGSLLLVADERVNPPFISPFLLMQNLSPKNITRSDIIEA